MTARLPNIVEHAVRRGEPNSVSTPETILYPSMVSETGFRQLYDPASRCLDMPITDFVEQAASSRYLAIFRGLGRITTHEALQIEATLFLADDAGEQNPGIDLAIHPDRQRQIRQVVSNSAKETADLMSLVATETAAEQAEVARHTLAPTQKPLLSPVLLACAVAASFVHNGASRRNGPDYITHPIGVASIGRAAMEQAGISEGHRLYEPVPIVSFLHDVFEAIHRADGSYIYKPILVSPLSVREMLSNYDVSQADDIMNSLMDMTRLKDSSGNRREYTPGVSVRARQRTFRGLVYRIVKLCDIQHNYVIDADELGTDATHNDRTVLNQSNYAAARKILTQLPADYELTGIDNAMIGKLLRAIQEVDEIGMRNATNAYRTLSPTGWAERVATTANMLAAGQTAS